MIGSGHMDFVIPDAYVKVFDPATQISPTTSYEDVRAVFKEDFNKEIEDVFSFFDPIPLASASLAQVHKAILKETG